ncbi:aquaporin-8-like [Nelusetta ayraudi]|uniref:aquaporin-8-like n=1 Tax=Nelusetta ayraudi TaxID=303726 RepID=UPI003F722243
MEEKVEMKGSGAGTGEMVSKAGRRFETLIQPCVAELLGTMFFVFITCVSSIENVPMTGRLHVALVNGFIVAALVAALKTLSGSHFNPALTVTVYLCGGIKLIMVGLYIVSQLIGGIFGAGIAKMMTASDRYNNASGGAFSIIKSDSQLFNAITGEVAMTCMVIMVFLLVAINNKTQTPDGPFIVGLTVAAALLAGVDVSGACLNPARAFGPAVFANYWTYHWVYWVGPIAGGLIAALLLRLLLGDERLRVVMKS